MSSAKKFSVPTFNIQKRLSSATFSNTGNRQCLAKRQSLPITRYIERNINTSCVKKNIMVNNLFRQVNIPDCFHLKNVKKDHYNLYQKQLVKSSDRMKPIYFTKQTQVFSNIVAISVDFIINEDYFWNEDSIKHSIAKDWKNLQRNKTIIWIIRRKSTIKKLKQFSLQHELRLDGVFFVKRKNNYTVDYNPVLNTLTQSVKNNPKTQIIILECIKINQKDLCHYQSYRGRIPILFSKEVSVKFGLVKIGHAEGLEKPIQYINQLLSLKHCLFKRIQLSNQIPNFIQQSLKEYYEKIEISKKIKKYKDERNTKSNELGSSNEQLGIRKLQQFKRGLISKMCLAYGRQHKIDGNSIHYFIGDLIKRNYQELIKQMSKCNNNKDERIQMIEKSPEQQMTTVDKQIEPINYLQRLKLQLKYYQFY